MNKDMLSKTLTLGVIILFATVGIQPALAVEPKVSSDNIENVEDCDCQEIDILNPFMFKLWLNKLKVVTKIIMSRFNHIPEVKEQCQELSNDISSVGIKDWFCDNLERVYDSTVNLFLYLEQKLKDEPRYIDGFLFLCTLYMIFFLNDIGVIFLIGYDYI
jgi:hypothetical protein